MAAGSALGRKQMECIIIALTVMSLSIGLVGLPNAGKSTLFNALTRQNVLVADYPFATIEPNLGIVALPDDRVRRLAEVFQAGKTTPATVSFTDIAGLVEGASRGEGLGNKFLENIRRTGVIAQVVGAFRSGVDAAGDIGIIGTELVLADWQVLAGQAEKLRKPAKSDKRLAGRLACLEAALGELDSGRFLSRSPDREEYARQLAGFNLLTLKPIVHVFNLAEKDIGDRGLRAGLAAASGGDCLFVSAKLELEISRLDSRERAGFLREYGLEQSGIEQLAEAGFGILGLQTFLTAGPKEARAWVIPRDCPAPRAAGAIHGDMERGFIAAEIVAFEDLVKLGSWPAARAAGLCRTEGKQYLMRDGDVADFRFNV